MLGPQDYGLIGGMVAVLLVSLKVVERLLPGGNGKGKNGGGYFTAQDREMLRQLVQGGHVYTVPLQKLVETTRLTQTELRHVSEKMMISEERWTVFMQRMNDHFARMECVRVTPKNKGDD